jgi:hypothetical protein
MYSTGTQGVWEGLHIAVHGVKEHRETDWLGMVEHGICMMTESGGDIYSGYGGCSAQTTLAPPTKNPFTKYCENSYEFFHFLWNAVKLVKPNLFTATEYCKSYASH